MKKITREIELYEYSELSKEAKKKALDTWNETNDLPFMQSMLNDECGQLLKENGITCTSNHPVCLYSLAHCQGDGLMFQGSFIWYGHSVKVKHSGHYYHSHSKTVDITKIVDGQEIEASENEYAEFEAVYQSICKELATIGYDFIESETSEERFIDECNANEWTFTKDGVMDNN